MTLSPPAVDLEQGQQCGPSPLPSRQITWLSSWARTLTRSGTASSEATCKVEKSQMTRQTTIEDLPLGYPRFSALIASHHSFQLYRRFSALRTRLLLLKQDKLSLLENRLEKMDKEDEAKLFLTSYRRDKNEERRAVLEEIDDALANYDSFLDRHQRALSFEAASGRPISNLQNWIAGNACIARNETAYLDREDLISIIPSEDNIVTWLGALVESVIVYFLEKFSKNKAMLGISRDPNVHIFPPTLIKRAVQILLAPFITILLLTPVIICNFINSLTIRLIIVVLTTAGFVAALSCLAKVRVVELIVAGATYTTVLVVFISGTGGASN